MTNHPNRSLKHTHYTRAVALLAEHAAGTVHLTDAEHIALDGLTAACDVHSHVEPTDAQIRQCRDIIRRHPY